MSTQYRILSTPAGYVGFVAGPRGLKRVCTPQRTRTAILRQLRAENPDAAENTNLLPQLANDLQRYFAGHKVHFKVRLDCANATDFQTDVWHACRAIRYGRTASYGDLANRVGRSGAARAVGTAMANNRFPIVVPCHRVLRSDGNLGGYSGPGGTAFKRKLLMMESTAT
jgi:methylated-DNA-[protein]-cysteine S-methyltransferase